MEFNHYSVMLSETVTALCVKDDGIYVDGTLGGGGHAEKILKSGKNVRLIGIDRDSDALSAAGKRLECFADRLTLVHDNFGNIKSILQGLKYTEYTVWFWIWAFHPISLTTQSAVFPTWRTLRLICE